MSVGDVNREAMRAVALRVQRAFNSDRRTTAATDASVLDEHHPPTFILGAPRSGTTLVYQVFVQQLAVSYISNLMAAVPCYMPELVSWFPGIATEPRGELQRGYHGFVSGLLAPSEAGKVFDRWLASEDDHLRRGLRGTLASITHATRRPVLVKSLTLSVALDRLLRWLPAASVVLVTRQPEYVAQSILLARRRLGRRSDEWWSVAPSGWREALARGEHYACAWQALEVDRMGRTALDSVGPRGIELGYEEFCRAPSRALDEVARRLCLGRAPRPPALPARFDPANSVRVPADDWDALRAAVVELTSQG